MIDTRDGLLPYAKSAERMPAPQPYQVPARIAVLRPKLASASEILPYLQTIDDQRWYSNCGPLVTRLEEQLNHRLGFVDQGIVSTSNGTLGLTVALLARHAPAGSLCLMPSWTFAATAHAARAAGMTPWFHDVDRRTWALNPDQVTETLRRTSLPVKAVIVVSPFGAPLDLGRWEEFEKRTGIPVVVDAAAGFDTTCPSRIPVVVSLHATKILGAGEGGFIATADPDLRRRLQVCCNFGFLDSRSAVMPALNAKMSEYHAAVALAGLANWPATRAQHASVTEWYRAAIGRLEGVTLQPGYGEGWVSSTTSVLLPAGSMALVTNSLLQSGIDTRKWWGEGCHVQPVFADCPRGPLPVTEELGERVLGLPHFPDMCRGDVNRVADALATALSGHSLTNLAETISGSSHY